jgi:protease I
MRKVLIITGDGGESYETLYALHRLREDGHEALIAAPTKRRINLVIHDFEPGWDTYIEKPGYGCSADLTIAEARAQDFDAILIMGGRAPEYLRNDKKLIALTQEFARLGKWVFSICHGIQILAAANLLKGKRITCYEHVRWEVETAGGTWCKEECVRDGNFVTSQTWNSHPEFYRELMACLADTPAAAVRVA